MNYEKLRSLVTSQTIFAEKVKDRFVHWCYGAPGATLCIMLAHQVWGCETEKYLGTARRAGEVVWSCVME